jgi:AcrR family transcriptional regulator
VRSAVLAATLQELAEGGYGALSFEGVAKRAGVHKTTLYRRWGTRESLMLEALLEQGRERVPIPDTGSLRVDLVAYGEAVVASVTRPETEAMVRAMVSVGDPESPLAEASRRFWSARIELAGAIVERAIARGELPPGTDATVVLEALLGAIYFRLLMSREDLEEGFVQGVAERLSAPPARPRARRPAAS